jgi:hypothetical protein
MGGQKWNRSVARRRGGGRRRRRRRRIRIRRRRIESGRCGRGVTGEKIKPIRKIKSGNFSNEGKIMII